METSHFNWRRGLFRLWAVFALVWLVASSLVLDLPLTIADLIRSTRDVDAPRLSELQEQHSAELEEHADESRSFDELMASVPKSEELINLQHASKTHRKSLDRLWFSLAWMIIPIFALPLALIATGRTVRWISKGFREKT